MYVMTRFELQPIAAERLRRAAQRVDHLPVLWLVERLELQAGPTLARHAHLCIAFLKNSIR